MGLRGRVALVTGAAQGIGRHYAIRLAQEGASVAIADVDGLGASNVADSMQERGFDVLGVPVDVTHEDEVAAAVAAVTSSWGGVDILVNNAAAHLTHYSQPCTVLPREDWRHMLELNLTAPMVAAHHCRPSMASRGGGVIINQSSMAAYSLRGAYGVSKAALNALTVALAAEMAVDGIRVNGIAPGLVDSPSAVADVSPILRDKFIDRQLVRRHGRMQDLEGALLYLCSEESSFMTGQTLIIDGGVTRRT